MEIEKEITKVIQENKLNNLDDIKTIKKLIEKRNRIIKDNK